MRDWLRTIPPAAGLIISCILLAWPAAASAAVISPAGRADTAAMLAGPAPWKAPPGPVTEQVHAVAVVRVIVAREAAADRRAEARRDARQAAAAAAAAAAAEAAQDAAAQPAPPVPSSSPVAVQSPQSAAGIFSYAQLEALWVSAGGPGWAEAQAAQIAICESGGNPNAYNPSGASGLWQILGAPQGWTGSTDWFNPGVNAAAAVAKFNESNQTFAQWVCQ